MIKTFIHVMWPDKERDCGFMRYHVQSVDEARELAAGHEDWAIEVRHEGVREDEGSYASEWFTEDGHVLARDAAAKVLLERFEGRG